MVPIRRSLRDQQKELIRTTLIEVGMDLLQSQGLAETTVEQITRAAGVSKGTFYNYFETKEDLLVAGMAMLQEQETTLAAASVLDRPTMWERLCALIDWSAGWVAAHPQLSLMWSLERLRRAIVDHNPHSFDGHLRAIVVAGHQAGELRQDRPAEQMFFELTALFVFEIARYVHSRGQHDLAAALKDAVRAYIEGAKGPHWEAPAHEDV